MQRYPHLSGILGALSIFESAARHRSFSRAAKELSLTQPAVSRRISNMEARLGIAVFERRHNKLELTPAGERIRVAVELSLSHLDKELAELSNETQTHTHTIACGLSFASLWLQPRFSRLRHAFPDSDFHLIVSEVIDQLNPQMVDIRILWQDNGWPDREIRALFSQHVFPVCSPEFASRHKLSMSSSVSRLAELPLLRCQTGGANEMQWPQWFARQQVEYKIDPNSYLHDSVQYMVQSTLESEGIALGQQHLVKYHIDRGDLIQIGAEARDDKTLGWIEFDPVRISKPNQDRIFNWFQNQLDHDPAT